MTVPRGQIVNSAITPYYHCISRCVRGALLCGHGTEDRKQWIEDRLLELAGIFAIEVCGYAVLDSHMHVVLRLGDDRVKSWSDEDVVRRWACLHPPKDKKRKPLEDLNDWVQQQLKDPAQVQELRDRLNNMGWFMKSLKEPLARLANKEEQRKGAFWDPRYKSIAILEDEALLTTLVYVDLNVMAAGLAPTPEDSPHTSFKARIDHHRQVGTLADMICQPEDRVRWDTTPEDEDFWLVPIHERRERGGQRAGISVYVSLASYILLLDWCSRLRRPGKASLPPEVAGILERLGSSPEQWQQRLEKLHAAERPYGVVFGVSAETVKRFAQTRGVTRMVSTAG